MYNHQLVQRVKELLRASIAIRLGISPDEYTESAGSRQTVNRQLTNIMALGYADGDLDAVVAELCWARHYGKEHNPTVVLQMRKELAETQRQFSKEIAAFNRMHRLTLSGAMPLEIWMQVRALVGLEPERAFEYPEPGEPPFCLDQPARDLA
jgi:hypothetical protein